MRGTQSVSGVHWQRRWLTARATASETQLLVHQHTVIQQAIYQQLK